MKLFTVPSNNSLAFLVHGVLVRYSTVQPCEIYERLKKGVRYRRPWPGIPQADELTNEESGYTLIQFVNKSSKQAGTRFPLKLIKSGTEKLAGRTVPLARNHDEINWTARLHHFIVH